MNRPTAAVTRAEALAVLSQIEGNWSPVMWGRPALTDHRQDQDRTGAWEFIDFTVTWDNGPEGWVHTFVQAHRTGTWPPLWRNHPDDPPALPDGVTVDAYTDYRLAIMPAPHRQ